ncbi:midasin [Tripterygium wilfordii]|uniref:midasin n=1 Tax=Tripterygium wilfordii TaxID=458696 RepID=UPI0018F84CFD|nr:midasin [Tripterygium wilfordii]
MAMDGSFSVKQALERFLARCPKLAGHPQMEYLLKKEGTLTEEEVSSSVAELFLHQSYTIPLIGCFRPISQRVVEKAVALLRLVLKLGSNSDDHDNDDDTEDVFLEVDDARVFSIIEVYVQRGRFLSLHELACLALCRALDLAPFLLGSVLAYFEFAPPPFQRPVLMKAAVAKSSLYLHPVRTSYRLLVMEPEVFSRLWDWSFFVQFVKKCVAVDLKWYGIQILCLILKLSDKMLADFGLGDEEAFLCWLGWEEFCQDVAMEKFALFIESPDHKTLDSVDGYTHLNQENCLKFVGIESPSSSPIHEIEPSVQRQKLAYWDNKSGGYPFVMTSMVKKSFEMMVLAVSQKWPVLLYGPPGAGKTALISKLARDSGNQVLSIHMDDQIDGKTLIGSYVCTEQPGEFRWQPGSLTQAVLNGFWVVFEDIDKAASDVQSILLPFLEGASSFVTSHGEDIKVAESFRLFSTMSTLHEFTRNAEGGNSLSALWRRVMIRTPKQDDLRNIIKAWYPNLESLAEKLVETFERVNSAFLQQSVGYRTGKLASSGSFSRFSLRDLLKWCKRIVGLGVISIGDGLSAYHCNCIFLEAVDIFAAFFTSAENRLTIMKDIAKFWAVPITEAETLYPFNKPVIQDLQSELRIGRVALLHAEAALRDPRRPFVEIRSSLHVLERIASSVKYNEPVLLVGETGTGKTTLVQNLAMRLGQKLTVLNLSQQSDVADLLGGFKPMDARFICIPLYKDFEDLFSRTTSVKRNINILGSLQQYFVNKNWRMLLREIKKVAEYFQRPVDLERPGSVRKRRKALDGKLLKKWENFSVKLETAYGQIDGTSGMVFSFVEGAFVTALKNGEWILLDEVNLAPPETLQRIIGVLEGEYGSLCLAERGDVSHIHRHPNFRIFGCMNPATDAGKRDLPFSLRSRFTEYFVDDVLDDEDLLLFIGRFMEESLSNSELMERIKNFYKAAKKHSEENLQDGANQKPQYSLRSLYRALEYTGKAKRQFGFQKAMYDGFCMFFLTLLDLPSAKIMDKVMKKTLLVRSNHPHIPFDSYLTIKESSRSDDFVEGYVLTKSVKEHLTNLARAIFIKRYPVLLQGPTSSGKTSLVRYLAAVTGHEFVRINNHEHTDLQEYLGSYITDACGKLVFHEGVLVKAVRNGYWVVLDELNLAPSDVLEALNRLLDDNRELFVPELCETVRAHPDFMLFATQNPPTFYGGRKVLSRAFRNRFVELHIDEIPDDELSMILEIRCQIPGSYATRMVNIMKDLQLHRQSSKVFAGKHGFITPRDLFRWANRYRAFGRSYEDLARDGYYLLAERLRNEDEKCVVQEVLEKHLRVKLIKDNLYMQELALDPCTVGRVPDNTQNVVWTKSMKRLYFLVKRCYELREPVLLVGETGGGKTTVCQLLGEQLRSKLHILNCHQYSETSDFLGGFYPTRDRSKLMSEFKDLIEQLKLSGAILQFPGHVEISSDIGQATLTLDQLAVVIESYRHGLVSSSDVSVQDVDTIEEMKSHLAELHQDWEALFKWQDGPLVQAMKTGDLFLVDEISLADDSVLERLNSVLEPERKLTLAEKGGPDLETVTAHENFFVLATMNPGGDYGKKELSPALRNRFTEIWVPPVSDLDELKSIALNRISHPELSFVVDPMLKFWDWFNQLETGRMLTIRDLLSWIAFINVTHKSLGSHYAFLHGVFLILLDGLSLGTAISNEYADNLREKCFSFLLEQLKVDTESNFMSKMENYGWVRCETRKHDPGTTGDMSHNARMECGDVFGIDPFYIEKGGERCELDGFEFLAPTTCRNALRVLRAMQLPKPVLLEGSPGVGKTSLIIALGKFSGHRVVRINLSEQTDIMDLLGSDLPVESDEGMKFAWSDGILLQALKDGDWVLLDELNLAPQSVLEGLNAILDHRAEVFIPELGRRFRCPSSFRVFACQNPSSQGSGRKGLPRSFLNRFTKVYVDELVRDDYNSICQSLYPSIANPVLEKLIDFNKRLHEDTMVYHKFAQDGSPWEFNLRDVIRSCQIIQCAAEELKFDCFVNILYIQRMRTASDRVEVMRIYEEIFGMKPFINPYPRVQVNSQCLIVGNAVLRRNYTRSKISNRRLDIMPGIRQSLEAVAHCIQHKWLCILVGPPSSGKTSLIRLLAQLTGNRLNELNLSSTTDISELLGCFEQYNAFRNFRSVVAQVECYVNEYCNLLSDFTKDEDLVTRWLAFSSSMDSSSLSGSTSMTVQNWKLLVDSLSLLTDIIGKLELVLKQSSCFSWTCNDLNDTMKAIAKLQEAHQRPFSKKFEWLAGPLIKALENGEWIILENANLCNPTVLDRINSLVEHCGSITVNERGIVDGKQLVLQPHPDFRMFLTVNPIYGEVSRAMRNRGVEIFMMQPYWLNDGSGNSCTDIELRDVKRFLVLSGVPVVELVDSMAKAHLYARDEGLPKNIRITFLELARWVQLFQQLLMNGNQPMWSLQTSWEHTYLSSFGEAVGGDIINHAKLTYLTVTELLESDLPFECSLHLSGSWPMPLKLKDFTSYPNEAYVKQNSMLLEYIGANCALYEIGRSLNPCPMGHLTSDGQMGKRTCVIDMELLCQIIRSKSPNRMISISKRSTEFDFRMAKKMLLFAANWTIEQATERDLDLYIHRIRWFSSQLRPCCQLLSFFVTSFTEELKHPIWKDIFHFRHHIASILKVDLDSQPVPLLSLEFVDMTKSNDNLRSCGELLGHAIECAGLLRVTYHRWNFELGHKYSDDTKCIIPVLKSLHLLEKEVLGMLVASPSFDLLIQLYGDLLEDHMGFSDAISSSQFEQMLICWRSLKKHVSKLQGFCPGAVENVLRESSVLDNVFQRSEKSLLWIHGGHPFMPASANLYNKHQQLLKLCESIWPTKLDSQRQENYCHVEVVASFNAEVRSLALQGVCLSSYIMVKYNDDGDSQVQKLEEMHQMLLRRYGSEKNKLKAKLGSEEELDFEENSSTCCGFHPENLCLGSNSGIWLDTLFIIDSAAFALDTELLEKLLSIILDDYEGLQQGLSSILKLLEFALNHSITFSTRPPQTYMPHQKLIWTLDAWMSVEAVGEKVSSCVLEMWFWWHSSLWTHSPSFVKNFSTIDGYDGYDIILPDMLVQPVKTACCMHVLQSTLSIKEYTMRCLNIKVVSCNLWETPSLEASLNDVFLSVPRLLFQQIIYAHRKAFGADNFAKIRTCFDFFQKNVVRLEDIKVLCSLIGSSSHQRFKALLHLFIEPLLKELYLHFCSTDFSASLGRAWFLIGRLRFSLLLGCEDVDPALKYAHKYSRLEERISSLNLEIKVRQECEYLAGCSALMESDKRRGQTLGKLETERKRLLRKMVFRSNPENFSTLKDKCLEFLQFIETLKDVVRYTKDMELQEVGDQVSNWQKSASCFIDQLSEYADYVDVTQPVQVAVYEMKLGLSLIMAAAMQRKFLTGIKEDNMDHVLQSIYSFMKFPRGFPSKSIALSIEGRLPGISSLNIDLHADFWALDMSLLEKVTTVSSQDNAGKMISLLQVKVSLYHNILVRIAHFVANARLMDQTSFMLLDKIFNDFVNIWMNMKVQGRIKEGLDARQYKFRPRAFKIERILEVDISKLGKLFVNDSFLEWQELLSEEDSTGSSEASEQQESSKEEWDLMQESILNDLVRTHNQLFGSSNLVLSPGAFMITDADRLLSFVDSYTLGVNMVKGLGGALSYSLDTKLVPEHLFRLCLDQEFFSSHKSASKYNFYKDTNAPVMFKMVKLLTSLHERILSLLSEWEDHPGLQKILDVIEMLLAIPIDTPLAKALSGLQFLLNRTRALQESGSKFYISDLLEPIITLVCSWQKMEFNSWPALLDEVQDQYASEAGKLWFPLFSVLQHRHCADIATYDQSTIESLEEFVQTSSIGEFRKRLQLLFAFHGQITSGRCLGFYSTPWQEKNLHILYNIFGYYVQFLPKVLEHIEANRRNIEMELKELLKLCRWEHVESYLSIENSKRTRQKLRKLIQKYSDLLQQPVRHVINEIAAQRAVKAESLQDRNPHNDILDKNMILLDELLYPQFIDEDGCMWYADWRKKLNDSVLTLHTARVPEICSLGTEEVARISRQCLDSQSTGPPRQEEWKSVWHTLEKLCRTTTDCNDLWKDVNKSVGKKRALSELLKLLENSGLQRHMFERIEISKPSNWMFLEPSYDARHLLLAPSRLSHLTDSTASEFHHLLDENLEVEWKISNEYYFKSMALVQLLQQISLKPHEDFTLEQTSRAVSFLVHLIVIQQAQRAEAYSFAKQLKWLRECLSALKPFHSNCTSIDERAGNECSVTQNQHIIFRCMWQQKQLLDLLCSMLREESLLLRTVVDSHSNSCQSVKPAANQVLAFIGKFIPVLQRSKESLDDYLLGHHVAITTVNASSQPYIITKQMEQLVLNNFKVIKEFEEQVVAFRKQDLNKGLAVEALLGHFEEVFEKGKLMSEQLNSVLETRRESVNACAEPESGFCEALKGTLECIMNLLQKIYSASNSCSTSEEPSGDITTWESLFKSSVADMSLQRLCNNLLETIFCAEKLADLFGNEHIGNCWHIGAHLKNLHMFLDIILTFGDGLLQNLLAVHKTVSILTHELARVLASLFSKGFGISPKDQREDDSSHDVSQDASGTGMGEGAGINDISDQINDEDQLLGASDVAGEEQDASGEVQKNNEKGIEMEQDFEADTFSVSEDSGQDDNEDNEEQQLDSAMGNAGADSEVVDEKLWNKDEDDNPNDTNEKYETGGPSAKDGEARELRAKEDSAITDDEPGEPSYEELDRQTDDTENQDIPGDTDDKEDIGMDKKEAFTDATGLQVDDEDQSPCQDMDTDEKESDFKEDVGEQGEPTGDGNEEEDNLNPTDETMEEADEQVGVTSEKEEPGKDHKEGSDMNLVEPSPGIPDFTDGNAESATEQNGESQPLSSRNAVQEANWSRQSEINNDFASHSNSSLEIDVINTDSSNGGKLTEYQPKTHLPQQEASVQKSEPNPCRNVGDALEEWKQKVKVSVDLQGDNREAQGDMEDENADEYGYVDQFENGIAQTLGPATSEQKIDINANGNVPDEDTLEAHRDEMTGMEVEQQQFEDQSVKHGTSLLNNKMNEQMHIADGEKSPEEGSQESHGHDEGHAGSLSDLVSVKRSYLSEDISQLSKLSVCDEQLEIVRSLDDVSIAVKNDATALWRRCELLTTRLSHELAEQLRLIMEPTIASKLQGDYKTGKRINMKKVIPYIASHYRKDKIWLRRTRPNKRDYQVVIAVDDSLSMSENSCGQVAIEALVIVCRAMSQLEMGDLAVVSFGKKGNIQLLHEFDQPFTGDAGIKMVSSLTFKQDNTALGDPVVDLLKYLNNMLDVAVAKARIPSGENPLEQLVLIIGDGRFSEKNLKTYVRDVSSRKCMVAYLILDNSKESIMDHLEALPQADGKLKLSKYLDFFPFPYYIVLRNIEALPRTLGNLLRQWFELMRYSRD